MWLRIYYALLNSNNCDLSVGYPFEFQKLIEFLWWISSLFGHFSTYAYVKCFFKEIYKVCWILFGVLCMQWWRFVGESSSSSSSSSKYVVKDFWGISQKVMILKFQPLKVVVEGDLVVEGLDCWKCVHRAIAISRLWWWLCNCRLRCIPFLMFEEFGGYVLLGIHSIYVQA